MNDHATGAIPPLAARIYGVATIAAPLLLLATMVAYVAEGEGVNHGVLGGILGIWAGFALVIAFVGMLRLLEPRAPRAAATLTIFALIGAASAVAVNMEAVFAAALAPDVVPFDAAFEMAGPVVILSQLPWGLFLPLSLVLLGILLGRTGTVSWWSGGLLIAGGVLFATAVPARIDILALITQGVLILAMVPIGWAMLTGAHTATPATSKAPHATHLR